MVKQKPERRGSASVSSREAENLISFLAFESFDDGNGNSNSNSNKNTVAPPPPLYNKQSDHILKTSTSTLIPPASLPQKVLEPATLIYHESARSIVFRDHIRRTHNQQRGVATPNTDNNITPNQSSVTHSPRPPITTTTTTTTTTGGKTSNKKNILKKKLSKKFPSLNSIGRDDDSIQSNDSGCGSKKSKSSKGSRRSKNRLLRRNRKESSSLADSQHSISSVDASTHNDDNHTGGGDGYCSDQPIKPQIIIANYTPVIEPLPALELGPYNEFTDLLQSKPFWWNENEGPEEAQINEEVWDTMSDRERNVVTMLKNQRCVVKTVKKADWTDFLQKFVVKDDTARRYLHPVDFKTCSKEERCKRYSQEDPTMPFNSFMTSVSLLPSVGVKMRCYGSTKEFCSGALFALPTEFHNEGVNEDTESERTKTWSWPSGYAAKTEFNISAYGDLINGREEALVSLSSLRSMNHTYLYEQDYEILGRVVKGGLKTLPYNEIYIRVGGIGMDIETNGSSRTFDKGIGIPIALFARSAAYGDLIALMRTKKRMCTILGRNQIAGIPLLYITPEHGVHVITEAMQAKLLHTMTNTLNPFQNRSIQHKTTIDNTSEKHLQQKTEELFDLDDDNIRDVLTPEECARLAGGFGATDDSVAHLLMDAMIEDFEGENEKNKSHHNLQNLINEGLTAAVRSGDFNTSRQLLILYTLVASRGQQERDRANSVLSDGNLESLEGPREVGRDEVPTAPLSPKGDHKKRLLKQFSKRSFMSEMSLSETAQVTSSQTNAALKEATILPPPPPPPLDTDRLRSATNSDGLLAVLGAAEVLKSMQNEAAKTRAMDAIAAIEEWIDKSENSVAYRLAHWRDLTAAQGDLKIATESRSHFMAFVSDKAIHNRKRFAKQLKDSIAKTNFESISFLKAIHDMVSTMHSPCLRLELLQFILGLDNRYSVAHVARSVELAATCLNISAYEAIFAKNDDIGENFITNN